MVEAVVSNPATKNETTVPRTSLGSKTEKKKKKVKKKDFLAQRTFHGSIEPIIWDLNYYSINNIKTF